MPSFKHKTNKKILLDEKTIITLDGKHREMEKGFETDKVETLPELRAKKKHLTKLLENKNINIEQEMEIRDNIKDTIIQIKQIKGNHKNYYLNNNKHIFDYFESKKEVSLDNNKIKILNSFFKVKMEDDDTNNTKNKDTVQQYLANMDESFIDVGKYICETDICQYCRHGELIPIDHEGIMVCNNCHKHVKYLVENEKPSYKEPPKEACFYAYKRINHFREILAQFQAKETTQIPEEVLENIKNQIRKERIDLTLFNNKKAKEILKNWDIINFMNIYLL